jgi:hypothetical protein
VVETSFSPTKDGYTVSSDMLCLMKAQTLLALAWLFEEII